MSNEISWRDKLAIVHAEILVVCLIAIALRDNPSSITEETIDRLSIALQRLEALKAAT